MRFVIVVASVLLVATAARADDRIERAKLQVEAADIDYKLGRFGDALDKYSKAYELYPAAPLLFNIGQCHKNLKSYDKAIFFFEGYLRDQPAAANRALVEDLIRESKAERDKQPQAPPPVVTPPPVPPVAPVTPVVVAPPAPPRPQPVPAQPDVAPPQPHSALVPVALIAAGAAAIAGGSAFYYYGQKRGPGEMFVYDDTRVLGGTMLVLGGASAIAGTIMLVRHSSSAPVASATAHGAYLGWVGTF